MNDAEKRLIEMMQLMNLMKNIILSYIFLMTAFVRAYAEHVPSKLWKIKKMAFILIFVKNADANLILHWKMQSSENVFRGLMEQN